MSWIGLRKNNSTAGTSVASDLAKALLGDPTDVMNAAKTRSALETDEYQRRLIREGIAKTEQEALAIGQQRARDHDTYMKGRLAGAQLRALQTENERARAEAARIAAAAEQPVPVPDIELVSGGSGAVPEHLRNYDERHQPIVAAPLRLPAGTPLDAYEPPVEVGEITDSFMARRGAPGDLTETGRQGIRGAVGFPMPALPPQPAGVPPELAQAPPPAGPVVGGAPDNPLVGGGQPLIDLRALLGGSDELPVPTLPEGYLTPPAVLDEIPPRPASVTPEPVPTPYLPDPAPGMVPMEDLPLPVEEPAPVQALRQPAGTPFPATVDTAPTASVIPVPTPRPEPPLPVGEEATPAAPVAEQAAASAAPPAAAPSQKPVDAPAKTKITIKGSDGAPPDAAGTIKTAVGPMPSEKIAAVYDAIWMGPGTYDDKMQATLRVNGMLDVDYDPRVGVGEGKDENATINAYTKLGGGSALPITSAVTGKAAARLAQETGKEDEEWRPLTAAERKAYNIPEDQAARINQDNKVEAIGSGGVKVVNEGEKVETETEKTFGRKQAEVITGLYDDALIAGEDEVSLGELERQLKKAPTGAGANIVIWANRFGIKLADGADELTAADAIISKLVPKQREEGSGTLSDKDVTLFRESMPNILNQPGGNAKIIKYLKGLVEYRKARGALASKVMNKTLSRDEFLSEVSKIPNPLADLSSDVTTPAPGGDTTPGETTSTRSPEDQKLYDKYRKKAQPSG